MSLLILCLAIISCTNAAWRNPLCKSNKYLKNIQGLFNSELCCNKDNRHDSRYTPLKLVVQQRFELQQRFLQSCSKPKCRLTHNCNPKPQIDVLKGAFENFDRLSGIDFKKADGWRYLVANLSDIGEPAKTPGSEFALKFFMKAYEYKIDKEKEGAIKVEKEENANARVCSVIEEVASFGCDYSYVKVKGSLFVCVFKDGDSCSQNY